MVFSDQGNKVRSPAQVLAQASSVDRRSEWMRDDGVATGSNASRQLRRWQLRGNKHPGIRKNGNHMPAGMSGMGQAVKHVALLPFISIVVMKMGVVSAHMRGLVHLRNR
jgi:hypothetical protein